MKKIFLLLIASLPFLMSCDLETSDNGNLDGYWHLMSVDTLATSKQCDMSKQKVFWAVQVNLIQLRGADHVKEGGEGREFYERFELKNNMLSLYDPHEKDRENGDPVITEERLSCLHPYGINNLKEQFEVLDINNHEMILKSSMLVLRFRKQ